MTKDEAIAYLISIYVERNPDKSWPYPFRARVPFGLKERSPEETKAFSAKCYEAWAVLISARNTAPSPSGQGSREQQPL